MATTNYMGLEDIETGAAVPEQILSANVHIIEREGARFKRPVNTVTAASPTIPTLERHYILVNAGSNNVSVQVPTAVGNAGLTYTFKRTDVASGFTAELVPEVGGQFLETATSLPLLEGQSITLFSNGTNWRQIRPVVAASQIGAIPTTEKGAANGVAPLDSGGKIDSSYLPAIAVGEKFEVDDETEMLALTAEIGDVAVRADNSNLYLLLGADPSVLANWSLIAGGGDVVSVHGRAGIVVAASGDYDASQITDLDEFVEDTVAALIQPGSVVKTYDDDGGTLILDVDIIGLDEEENPAADDSFIVQEPGGTLKRVELANLPAGTVPDFEELGGVVATGPSEGEVLVYDENGDLVNATLATAGIAAVADLANYVPVTDVGAADGVASLDGSALILVSELPPTAIDAVWKPADTAAMLLLSASQGDLAIVQDGSGTYQLNDPDPTTFENWELISTAALDGATIKSLYEAEADTNAFDDAALSKLANIEALADVTDSTNVANAGAVMDDDFSADSGDMFKASTGSYAAIKANMIATTDPGTTDDVSEGYAALSRWLNTVSGHVWMCVDPTEDAAVWRNTTTGEVGGLTEGAVLFGASGGGIGEDAGVLSYDPTAKRLTIQRAGDVSVRLKSTGGSSSKTASSPGGEADDDAVGLQAWSNLANIRTDDTAFAGATLVADSNLISHYLITGPVIPRSVGVPIGATITGMEWSIRRLRTNAFSGTFVIADNIVRMTLNGSLAGDDNASATLWPTTAASEVYGGASDLWGLTVTDESELALAVSAVGAGPSFQNEDAKIEYITLTIHYTYEVQLDLLNDLSEEAAILGVNGVEHVRMNADGTVVLGGVSNFAGVSAYKTSSQSIPNITYTPVTFDAEWRDDGEIHSTVSQTERFVAPVQGWYDIKATITWQNVTTGARRMELRKYDGSTKTISANHTSPTPSSIQSTSASTFMNPGDYVYLEVYQGSGGSLNVLSSGTLDTRMTVVLQGG